MEGIFASPYTTWLGIQAAGEGVEMTARPEHTAVNGFVHAGALTTLLEMAAAHVVPFLAVPHVISLNLFRPASPDDTLRGTATILNTGKSGACVHSTIFNGEKSVATSMFTFARIEERSS